MRAKTITQAMIFMVLEILSSLYRNYIMSKKQTKETNNFSYIPWVCVPTLLNF